MADDNGLLAGPGNVNERGIVNQTLNFKVESWAECLTVGPASFNGLFPKRGGRSWAPDEAGNWKVAIVYEGMNGTNDPDPEARENFEWLPARSEEPIESHPLIEKLITRYAGTIDPTTKKPSFARYLAESGDPLAPLPGDDAPAGDRIPNPMFGRESYLLKTGVWRWTFGTRSYPQKWEDQDGRVITNVPGGRSTPRNKNWLVLFQKASPAGAGQSLAYDVVLDFLLSPRGGWPPSQAIFDLTG